ncbi:MAG: hypothetical protein VYA71_07190 [Pseudomonadota bacterium]|nr:hypothetical protein [Pseudomonadota bacterium]
MNPIYALWGHPRSMSTAMERAMRERGDCRCFHEPFLYHYYVGRGVREMPLLEYDPATPTSYGDIRAMVLEAAEAGPVFFKDMAYYVVPALFDDPAFASRITHSFLIRDPVKALLSYYKLDPEFILEEGGLEAEWRLVEWLRETTGETPVVIEAEVVQQDPEAAIGAYCRRLGLAPVAGLHQWSRDDVPEDWGQVVGWHGKVTSRGGIVADTTEETAASRAEFKAATKKAPQLATYLDHHMPFYDKLRALAV